MGWAGGDPCCRICLSGRILPWPAVMGSWPGAVPHKFTDTAPPPPPAGREHSQPLCQLSAFLEPVTLLLCVQGARVSRPMVVHKVPSWPRA